MKINPYFLALSASIFFVIGEILFKYIFKIETDIMTFTPIIWIVGENQSPRDLDVLEDLVLSKVTEIIYYGKHETKIKYLFGSKIKYSQLSTIRDAVNMALNNPTKNISVLFSPACSSYITHENYQLRGDYFKNLIFSID